MDLSQFFPALPQYGQPTAPNVGPGVPQNPMTVGSGQMPNPLLPAQQRGQFVNVPQAPQSGGMFGGGRVSIDLSRALAGYLAGIGNPAGVQTLQGLNSLRQQQMQHQLDLQDYNRKRADDNADFITHEDYKAAHDVPDISQRIAALNSIKPGLGDTYAQNYAANGGGLGPVLTNPLTGQTMMPANKAPAQEAPAEAIARLKSNPAEAAQFDEVFGPGASAKVLGGPTPSASGNFPGQ
jgi:hypothetical protein